MRLLKNRINGVPDELFDVLGLKSSDFPTDFIRTLYINQTFHYKNQTEISDIKNIQEVMATSKNVAIVGGAGAGKTTTLKYIANELCDALVQLGSEDHSSSGYSEIEIERAQKELHNTRSSLALIEERISEYPLSTDVPLVLVKERNELIKRNEDLVQLLSATSLRSHQQQKQIRYQIPVFIQLGELTDYLAQDRVPSIEFDALLEYKLSKEFRMLPGLSKELLNYLESGELCILLDGLDELVESSGRNLVDMLVKLGTAYRPQVILTSRAHTYPYKNLPEYVVLEINKFDAEQVDDYLVRWYSDIYKSLGSIFTRRLYAWSLYNKIKNGGLLEIAKSPLIVTQIVILHRTEKDLSINNVRVLQQILRLLLFRWRSGLHASYLALSRLREKTRISDDEILLITGSVAFHLLNARAVDNSGLATRAMIIECIQEHIDELEIDYENAADVIFDYLQNCYGILTASTSKPIIYSFANQKIQEYLAAYYLMNVKKGSKNYTEQLPSLIERDVDAWSDVTLFVCDLLPTNAAIMFAQHIFWRLDASSNTNHIKRELLCGKIVDNLISKGYDLSLYVSLIDAVRDRMKRIVDNETVTWYSAVTAGRVLGNLGDERSSIEQLKSPNYWLEIPPGNFEMGRGDEKHMVSVEKFYVAKYSVTNEQYNAFVKESRYTRVPENWDLDKPYLYMKNYPVVGIHWKEALDFANWASAYIRDFIPQLFESDYTVRIPTESEWEKVALEFTNNKPVLQALNPNNPSKDHRQFIIDHDIWPIGLATVHDQRCRIYDLFNHVWEWTTSAYKPYPYEQDDGRNNINLNQPRVIRGGYAYLDDVDFFRTYRGQCHMYRPVYRMNNVGFRLIIGRKLK